MEAATEGAERRKRLRKWLTAAAIVLLLAATGALLWFYGERFLAWVKAAIDTIPEWVRLLIAALATLSEAVPVLGLIVPSNTLVALLSWHAGATGASPLGLILAHTAGSLVGDVAVYALGARYGLAFMERWPGIFRLTAERRAGMERLVHAHAMKTVILARFQPGTRSFAPYVAGAVRLPFGKYMAASVIASLGLALVVVLGGWLAGIGLETLGKALGWAATGVVVAIVVLAGLYYWLTHRMKLMTGLTMTLALVGAVGTGLAAGLLLDAAQDGRIQGLETEAWLHALPTTGAVPLTVSTLLGWPTLLAAFAAWCVWQLSRGRRREAVLAFAAGPLLLAVAAAGASAFPRGPPMAPGLWIPSGFPEPTAALAASLAGVLLWELLPAGWPRAKRQAASGGAMLAAALLAAQPLAAGRSWPTETVGGLALGAAWVSWCLLVDTGLAFRAKRGRAAKALVPMQDPGAQPPGTGFK